jgi:hypothetical protein
MIAKITDEIAEAIKSHDRPLELEDDSGQVYFVLTQQQFRQYVYDDSDLSSEEMMAAAACALGDLAGWGAPGMEGFDRDDAEVAS